MTIKVVIHSLTVRQSFLAYMYKIRSLNMKGDKKIAVLFQDSHKYC